MEHTLKNAIKTLQIAIDESEKDRDIKPLLVIKTKPILKATKKGAELNDGYDFEVNGAIPELADGIAKFAKELEPNGFGKGSGKYFVALITQYFEQL